MGEFAFIPGESLNGGLARWAADNDVERMIDVTAAAGVEYAHRASATGLDVRSLSVIAAEIGADVGDLVARATPAIAGDSPNQHNKITFYGTPLPSFMIEKSMRRFAPAALAKSPHHRAIWDVRLFPFCTQEWQFLLDSCGNPDCDGRPGWRYTSSVEMCEHCMADLTIAAATPVPASLHPDLRVAAGLVDPDPEIRSSSLAALPEPVAALGTAHVVDLLMRVMPVVDRHLPFAAVQMLNALPTQLCHAVVGAWRVLASWPDGMNDLASDRIATRVGRHNDGNGGRTMRFISSKAQKAAPRPVFNLILDWRRSIDISQLEGDRRRFSTISAPSAAAALGLDTNRVVEHRRARNLTTRFVLDYERPEARLDAKEIDDILVEMMGSSCPKGVRLRLGTSRHGVEQLVSMDLLEAAGHPFLQLHYGTPQIVSASVDLLEAALRLSAGGSPTKCTMPLRLAMKGVGARQKPWGPVIRLLLNGEVEFVVLATSDRLSDAILLDPRAAPILAHVQLPERVASATSSHMSKVDAGELLNLNARKTTAVLSHVPSGRGTPDPTVSLAEVARIGQIHIAAVELAVRRGVDAKRAYWEAVHAGVPVLGPGGFCRMTAERTFF